MAIYKAPLEDMRFVLQELFQIETALASCPALSEFSWDVIESVLTEAAKLNETLLFPLNQTGDQQGCQFENRSVKTPEGFKEAYQTFVQAGWASLAGDPHFGGQGMPQMVHVLCQEMCCSSNVSFSLYPELTHGVAYAIATHATDAIKQQYLPKLISGEWTGVMCLTESHAGSDLGLLRTKAEPQQDGAYQISGTKIFITGGEHDLTDNIIHLVLARIPGAPPGVRGISLFLVPKFLVNSKGELTTRNPVYCGSIEHKMGLKGSATCVMNYENATGYLIGEPHQGLSAMFTIMNLERLAIGMQGLGLSEVSYQNAAHYAKERLQGRAANQPLYPDKMADPIIVHPDIRRLLLTMKAYNEGARALAVWVAMQVDLSEHHTDPTIKAKAQEYVALLTPVVKAFFSDYGFDTCNMGLQVFGGHGYISEWGVEQYVRDARIAQIYEGTNGIQALDLVKRKLVQNGGQSLRMLMEDIQLFIQEHQSVKALQVFLQPLQNNVLLLEEISQWIIAHSTTNDDEKGAAAHDYLHLFSLVMFAYMWARMAAVAVSRSEESFYQEKLYTAQFYFKRILPKTQSLALVIKSGSAPLMQMPTSGF